MSTVAGKVRMTLKGAWNSASAYEILDVVMSADGVSAYMAKKDVPAGTALTNTEYWDAFLSVDDAVAAANAAADTANSAATNANGAADEARAAAKELSDEFKGIVDKLTTPFEESGSIIQCHPVEGYPLDVTVHLEPIQEGSGDPYPAGGGRNLAKSVTASSETASYSVNLYVDADILPDTTYTISFVGTADCWVYLNELLSTYTRIKFTGNRQSVTFTTKASLDAQYINGKGWIMFKLDPQSSGKTVTYTDVQLELGSTATDYAPYSNIRPISGHTGVEVVRAGKNLADLNKFAAIDTEKIRVDGDDIIISAGSNIYGVWMDYPGFFKVGQTYTFSVKNITNNADNYGIRIRYQDGILFNGGAPARPPLTFTPTKPVRSIYFYVGFGYTASADVVISGFQIELGSTATSYAPYTGDTYATEFPEMVYGADVRVSEGEAVGKWAFLELTGDESWAANVSTVTARFHLSFTGYASGLFEVLCDRYRVAKDWGENISENGINSVVFYKDASWEEARINITLPAMTLDDWKAYLAAQYAAGTPVQIAYQLATPTTLSVTPHTIPALDGLNTVYADAGDVTVKGATDPDYLNQDILNRLAALEAAAVNNA